MALVSRTAIPHSGASFTSCGERPEKQKGDLRTLLIETACAHHAELPDRLREAMQEQALPSLTTL
jgi:hypothetical protein